jgi:Resolvase, N terminal domain
MPQHMDMDRERKPSGFPSPFNHASNAHAAEGLAALIDEDVGVEFVVVDNHHANKLTIHILAAVAEHEREGISERTKAALAAAKARGKKLGTPDSRRRRRAHAGGPQRAVQFAANALPIIRDIRAAGHTSLGAIAGQLRAHRFGVRVNHAGDYPARLRDARHRVELLYYQGAWELTETRSVVYVCIVAGTAQRSGELEIIHDDIAQTICR